MKLVEYTALQKQVDMLRSQKDKLEGSLEQLNAELKEEFDCDRLEQAECLLFNLEQELEKEESKFKEDLEAWEDKYRDRL